MRKQEKATGIQGELPDVDLMGKPVFVVFDMDAYYQSQGGGTGDDGNSVKTTEKDI